MTRNYLANLSVITTRLLSIKHQFLVCSPSFIVPFKDPRANRIEETLLIAHCRPDPSLAAIYDATKADLFKLFKFSIIQFC